MSVLIIPLHNVSDFEDGIYSAGFTAFNGNDTYTIAVKAKGEANKTKWNLKGLQPSGLLPDKISK